MSAATETASLSSITEKVIDYRGKTPPGAPSGIPVITAAHVKKGKVAHCGKKFVSQETYDRWTTRGFIKPGDVLITTEAPVGQIAFVPSDRTYLITRRVIALQIDLEKADEKYVKYALLSPDVDHYFDKLSHGTTVPRLYKDDILDYRIPFPDLPTQHKIAGILSAYDDLIENNLRRISILEEMAQSLYREWFVHFRFPGHEDVAMVDSPLGPIPEGWEVKKLKDIASVNGQSIRKSAAPENIHYIDIKSVSTGSVDEIRPLTFEAAPSRARRIVQHGDIIWSTVH
jgi:type I restriction enzyme S subunit